MPAPSNRRVAPRAPTPRIGPDDDAGGPAGAAGRRLSIRGSDAVWQVLELGSGGSTLLALPGGLGMVDGAGDALQAIAASRRVLALEYPPVRRMTALVDGIVELLDQLGLATVDVLGSSYGAWVAQCLLRRHPTRVRCAVLAHGYALRAQDAKRLRIAAAVWRVLPPPLFRAMVTLRVRAVLAPARAASRARYERVMLDVRAMLAAPDAAAPFIAQQHCMIESLTAMPPDAGETVRPAHTVGIIESDDDPVIGARARERLRAAHPHAVVRRFRGTGHVTALVAPAAFADAVAALTSTPRASSGP